MATQPIDELTEDSSGIWEALKMAGRVINPFKKGINPLGLIPRNLSFRRSNLYRPATQSIGSYTPAQLNQMNALGGYYSEPARAQRRIEKRRLNVLNRAAKGKAIGNVNKLLGQYGYTQDAGGNLQFTGGNNAPSVGQQTAGRSDRSWKSDPFAHGGLASLWQR